jgi:hypothetical protein
MRIILTEEEINLQQAKDGTYSFRINNNVKVENIPTKEEAIKHAEKLAEIFTKQTFK